MVNANNIKFEYIRKDAEGNVIEIETALDDVSIQIQKGQFIAILGHNGSGKSTFAKHINALLTPDEGTVYIDGDDTKDLDKLYEIRQKAGMVFQNPDNQIIATVVDEDVAFGPENMGVPTGSIAKRVETALKSVGMLNRRKDSPNKLSGGQKQRVAIAGIMAMHPQCIVLDEPTAMLDPGGREDVIRTITKLNKENHITIILITHNMDETIGADKIFVMDHGKVAMEGTPNEIFARVDELTKIGLEVPFATRMAYQLQKQGLPLVDTVLNEDELAEQIIKCAALMEVNFEKMKRNTSSFSKGIVAPQEYIEPSAADLAGQSSLILQDVSYVYSPGTAYEKKAVMDVNLTFTKGEFVCIVGHTGSGKSTLIQHLNGLVKPTNGMVLFCGENVAEKEYPMNKLRSKVGLTFQYPEHQLFESTVFQDVAFGPTNLGLPKLKVEQQSYEAIKLVGLPDDCYDSSPFELSGGQKRRVAIAGVLAMKPDYLVLDEPTAGLDPKGRDEILELLHRICKENGTTIILVSHSMEDAARYADRLVVLKEGSIAYNDVPERVFIHKKELEQLGLKAPKVTYLMDKLAQNGFPAYPYMIKEEEALEVIQSWFA